MSLACVYYLRGGGDRITVCGEVAPYLYNGCSYCRKHIEAALRGNGWGRLARAVRPGVPKPPGIGAVGGIRARGERR